MSPTAETRRERRLVELLPLVTYVVALDAHPVGSFVSPQVERFFGYTPEEILSAPDFWERCIHPDDRPRFAAAVQRLRETHGQMRVEYRARTRDGAEVWVRDVGEVTEGDDGLLYVHGFLTDVTHEKELERQLAAERALAEAFFRDSPVGLGITDGEGRYLRVNDALARLNGAPAEAHVGRTLAEVAPDLAAAVDPMLRAVMQTNRALREQELALGEQVRLVASIFPIETGDETQYGRIVIDVTEQHRAEEERAAAERQYRRLIEQLPLVTYVNAVEPELHAIYVSPQIEELCGYRAQEWLEDSTLWHRVVHPDDLQAVVDAEAEARTRREPVTSEYRVVRPDGTVRWVLDMMESVVDENGTPQVEQGFLVDVTQRKEHESLFRAVFDNALEAMVIADDEGRYVDVNPAACELFGRRRSELLGLRARDVSPSSTAGAWSAFLERGEAVGAYAIVRPDGTIRETEGAAKANVVPGRHLSVMRDVTDRKQLEQDLWRAQRLDSVGRLAGGIAQDFNNLLTAIRGYAQLLLARAEPGALEQQYAQEIDRASDRAAELTAQLLAFGRRQVLQPRAVELNRLVESLRGMLDRVAAPAVALEVDLDPAVPAVRVDPTQIEQVLLNLVANAVDAMPDGGRVVVRTAAEDVDDDRGLRAGRYAVLSVVDEGGGIDETTLEHLFEPFFTTKPMGQASGLGLATAYGIVRQSGGTILVATDAGAGSTFSVYLPEAAAAVDEPQRPDGRGETVLVVDGDPAVRDVLFELLTDAGYRAVTTPSIAEALVVAERLERTPEVVIVDGEAEAAALAERLPAVKTLALRKPYTPADLHHALRLQLRVAESGDTAGRNG